MVHREAARVCALSRRDLGTPISEVCRKLWVAEQPFRQRKNRYGGMLPGDRKRLRQLEEKNATSIFSYSVWVNFFRTPQKRGAEFARALRAHSLAPSCILKKPVVLHMLFRSAAIHRNPRTTQIIRLDIQTSNHYNFTQTFTDRAFIVFYPPLSGRYSVRIRPG